MRIHSTNYRLLALLLFQRNHPAISVYERQDDPRGKKMLVGIGPIARELRLSNGRLLDNLEFLASQGHLTIDRKPRPGLIDITLLLPEDAIWQR